MNEVYKKLAKHLSSLGMGYPETEDLLEILKKNFTPLESEVALAIPSKVIPFEPTPVSEIVPPQNISTKELETILSNLAQRGLLFSNLLDKPPNVVLFSFDNYFNSRIPEIPHVTYQVTLNCSTVYERAEADTLNNPRDQNLSS